MCQVRIGIVEEEFACRRLALATHTRAVYGKGDATHEQRLPHGLSQHDPLGSQDELLALVGVGCGAGLPHRVSDVTAGIVKQVAWPRAEKNTQCPVIAPGIVEQQQAEVLVLAQGACGGQGRVGVSGRREITGGSLKPVTEQSTDICRPAFLPTKGSMAKRHLHFTRWRYRELST